MSPSSANLVSLAKPTVADEIKETVLKLIRDLLAEAERGEIDCLIVIAGYPNGDWVDKCSDTLEFDKAIGRLEITKQEWIAEYLDSLV